MTARDKDGNKEIERERAMAQAMQQLASREQEQASDGTAIETTKKRQQQDNTTITMIGRARATAPIQKLTIPGERERAVRLLM